MPNDYKCLEDFVAPGSNKVEVKFHQEKYTPEGRRWVNPGPDNRSRNEYPYGYSAYYLWGVPAKGHEATYSDRLSQWDRDKFAAATKSVNVRFENFSRQDAEAFLSAYFDQPVQVSALAQCCNVSSGYPIWIFFHSSVVAKVKDDTTTATA